MWEPQTVVTSGFANRGTVTFVIDAGTILCVLIGVVGFKTVYAAASGYPNY